MANRVKVETYRKEKYVGRGFVEHEPFTSIRALLEITAAEDDFGEYKGERQEKVQAELKVIEYEESDEREGDTFRDWFPYKAGKNAAGEAVFGIKENSKLGNLVRSCKNESYLQSIRTGKSDFDPADLIGRRFYAQVEESQNGKYSRIAWKTIAPVVKKKTTKQKQAESFEPGDDLPSDDATSDENNPLFNEEAN